MKGAPLVRKLVALALEEDLALGDVTSELSVSRDHQSMLYWRSFPARPARSSQRREQSLTSCSGLAA